MSESIRIEGPTPRTWPIARGAPTEFRCTVSGPQTRVLQWRVGAPGAKLADFEPVAGATTEALSVKAAKDVDYVLVARPSADAEEGAVTSARAELRIVDEAITEPWEYDAAFTRDTFRRLALVWLAPIAALVAAMVLAGRALPEATVPALVALQLLAIGTALALSAAYVALMEVRGISRAAGGTPQDGDLKAAGAGDTRGLEIAGTVEEVAKAAPRVIETFGKLRVSAALMLLTGVVLLAATAIGWRALPTPSAGPEGGATNDTVAAPCRAWYDAA